MRDRNIGREKKVRIYNMVIWQSVAFVATSVVEIVYFTINKGDKLRILEKGDNKENYSLSKDTHDGVYRKLKNQGINEMLDVEKFLYNL